jgi:hypothetical protein
VTDAVPADHTAVPVEGVRRRPIILQAGEDSPNELEPGGTVVSTATETHASRVWLDDPQDLFRTVKSLVAGLATGMHTEGAL